MTSVADWLHRREPPPPEPLLLRIHEALGDGTAAPAHEAAARTVAAAERLLGRLLSEDCATRAAALELLTADALVTYAFEAAAEHQSGSIDDMAAGAMQRIAALRGGAS